MDILPLLDELRMLARNALPFTHDRYDRERYIRILELVDLYYGATLDLPPAEVQRRLGAELGRITPNVGANAAIFDQQGALLLMQRSDDRLWCLPGGLVEVNETPAETAIRETREETGLDSLPVQLVDLFTRPAKIGVGLHSLIAVVYLCEAVGGTLCCSPEGIDVRFWPIDAVPAWHSDHLRQARAAYDCWLARHDAIG
jgi:ADP-ribose pyrophosphatase YjhB (NUDIX family)